MSYRRPAGGGDGRYYENERHGEYQHNNRSQTLPPSRRRDEEDDGLDTNGRSPDYPSRRDQYSRYQLQEYDDYAGTYSGTDGRYTSSPSSPSRSGREPPASEQPAGYGSYGRQLSAPAGQNGIYQNTVAVTGEFLDAEVARARVSDSSSLPSSGGSGDNQGVGIGMGVQLKDDHAEEFNQSYGSNLGAIQEETMGSGTVYSRNLVAPMPRRPKSIAPTFGPVEPSRPMRQVDRRYRKGKEKRFPDVTRGEIKARHLRSDEQMIQCTGCRSDLIVRKSSVLVKCPNCSHMGPTVGTSGSLR